MAEAEKPKKRHLNAEQRRALKSAELQTFVQQYGRRAQKNVEPNDRSYDRELEQRIKQMKPDELDRLLREDED
jgi:hypothetical protein